MNEVRTADCMAFWPEIGLATLQRNAILMRTTNNHSLRRQALFLGRIGYDCVDEARISAREFGTEVMVVRIDRVAVRQSRRTSVP